MTDSRHGGRISRTWRTGSPMSPVPQRESHPTLIVTFGGRIGRVRAVPLWATSEECVGRAMELGSAISSFTGRDLVGFTRHRSQCLKKSRLVTCSTRGSDLASAMGEPLACDRRSPMRADGVT